MASVLVLPSFWRRARYFLVRSSQARRTITMGQRAAWPWRSPPRLGRCRLVLPRLAGIGLLPQRAANAASDCIRWGLSPAVISRAEATAGPTPVVATSFGATAAGVGG